MVLNFAKSENEIHSFECQSIRNFNEGNLTTMNCDNYTFDEDKTKAINDSHENALVKYIENNDEDLDDSCFNVFLSDRFRNFCGICNEPYKDPRILSCLHTFCYACITKNLSTEFLDENTKSEKNIGNTTDYNEYSIKCLICSHVTEIPTDKLINNVISYSVLPLNYMYSHDKHHQNTTNGDCENTATDNNKLVETCGEKKHLTAVSAQNLENDNNNAICTSTNAETSTATQCVNLQKNFENSQLHYKNHNPIIEPQNQTKNECCDTMKETNCPHHTDQNITHWCNTCEISLCTLCLNKTTRMADSPTITTLPNSDAEICEIDSKSPMETQPIGNNILQNLAHKDHDVVSYELSPLYKTNSNPNTLNDVDDNIIDNCDKNITQPKLTEKFEISHIVSMRDIATNKMQHLDTKIIPMCENNLLGVDTQYAEYKKCVTDWKNNLHSFIDCYFNGLFEQLSYQHETQELNIMDLIHNMKKLVECFEDSLKFVNEIIESTTSLPNQIETISPIIINRLRYLCSQSDDMNNTSLSMNKLDCLNGKNNKYKDVINMNVFKDFNGSFKNLSTNHFTQILDSYYKISVSDIPVTITKDKLTGIIENFTYAHNSQCDSSKSQLFKYDDLLNANNLAASNANISSFDYSNNATFNKPPCQSIITTNIYNSTSTSLLSNTIYTTTNSVFTHELYTLSHISETKKYNNDNFKDDFYLSYTLDSNECPKDVIKGGIKQSSNNDKIIETSSINLNNDNNKPSISPNNASTQVVVEQVQHQSIGEGHQFADVENTVNTINTNIDSIFLNHDIYNGEKENKGMKADANIDNGDDSNHTTTITDDLFKKFITMAKSNNASTNMSTDDVGSIDTPSMDIMEKDTCTLNGFPKVENGLNDEFASQLMDNYNQLLDNPLAQKMILQLLAASTTTTKNSDNDINNETHNSKGTTTNVDNMTTEKCENQLLPYNQDIFGNNAATILNPRSNMNVSSSANIVENGMDINGINKVNTLNRNLEYINDNSCVNNMDSKLKYNDNNNDNENTINADKEVNSITPIDGCINANNSAIAQIYANLLAAGATFPQINKYLSQRLMQQQIQMNGSTLEYNNHGGMSLFETKGNQPNNNNNNVNTTNNPSNLNPNFQQSTNFFNTFGKNPQQLDALLTLLFNTNMNTNANAIKDMNNTDEEFSDVLPYGERRKLQNNLLSRPLSSITPGITTNDDDLMHLLTLQPPYNSTTNTNVQQKLQNQYILSPDGNLKMNQAMNGIQPNVTAALSILMPSTRATNLTTPISLDGKNRNHNHHLLFAPSQSQQLYMAGFAGNVSNGSNNNNNRLYNNASLNNNMNYNDGPTWYPETCTAPLDAINDNIAINNGSNTNNNVQQHNLQMMMLMKNTNNGMSTTHVSNMNHHTTNTNNYPNNSTPMKVRVKFGSLGSGMLQFNSPHGFCLGVEEEIIIADTSNHRIQVYTKSGAFKGQFGTPGREEGQLWYPRKIAVNKITGAFIVCDRGSERSRMQIFDSTGAYVRKIPIRYIDIVAGLAITEYGSPFGAGHIIAVDSVTPTVFRITEAGELLHWFDCSEHMREPSDVAVRGTEYYVCDFKGHCVAVFSEAGTFLRRIGREGITNFPNGIDVSEGGEILVGDSHGNRFHVAVFRGTDGTPLGEFECPHVKVSRCCGLAITAEGYVVTLAKNNHYVLVLDTLFVAAPPVPLSCEEETRSKLDDLYNNRAAVTCSSEFSNSNHQHINSGNGNVTNNSNLTSPDTYPSSCLTLALGMKNAALLTKPYLDEKSNNFIDNDYITTTTSTADTDYNTKMLINNMLLMMNNTYSSSSSLNSAAKAMLMQQFTNQQTNLVSQNNMLHNDSVIRDSYNNYNSLDGLSVTPQTQQNAFVPTNILNHNTDFPNDNCYANTAVTSRNILYGNGNNHSINDINSISSETTLTTCAQQMPYAAPFNLDALLQSLGQGNNNSAVLTMTQNDDQKQHNNDFGIITSAGNNTFERMMDLNFNATTNINNNNKTLCDIFNSPQNDANGPPPNFLV